MARRSGGLDHRLLIYWLAGVLGKEGGGVCCTPHIARCWQVLKVGNLRGRCSILDIVITGLEDPSVWWEIKSKTRA